MCTVTKYFLKNSHESAGLKPATQRWPSRTHSASRRVRHASISGYADLQSYPSVVLLLLFCCSVLKHCYLQIPCEWNSRLWFSKMHKQLYVSLVSEETFEVECLWSVSVRSNFRITDVANPKQKRNIENIAWKKSHTHTYLCLCVMGNMERIYIYWSTRTFYTLHRKP